MKQLTKDKKNEVTGFIFDIQDFAVHDGPGIRTTIFMKGCPLRCDWCANPEGQTYDTKLMHSRVICEQCQKCEPLCPYDAIQVNEEDYPIFDRDICADCEISDCNKACLANAIKFAGEEWTPAELYKKVKTNVMFYRNSEGGVTFSGGEPLTQPDFIRQFFKFAEKTGLSVGLETCGAFNWDEVKDFVDRFDFIYYDLKAHDPELHKEVTGQGNQRIVENLKKLAEMDADKITITIAIIPGVNDRPEMFRFTAGLCNKIGISKIRLLPYHSMGQTKYHELGREYPMEEGLEIEASRMKEFKNLIEDCGIDCWIE